MILNENYFDDLEIKDEDIIEDDTLDVEEPEQEMDKKYNHCLILKISNLSISNRGNTSTKTILLPKIIKMLDAIFDFYGIKHS